MSTIITRNSATSGSVPSSLVQGELAINVTNNRLFFGSGSGNTVKEFGVTASYALNALSASFATLAQTANTASYVVTAQTASYVLNAVSASFAINALSASYAQTASYVTLAQTASYVQNAQTASYVLNAVSASFASTASYVLNAISASYYDEKDPVFVAKSASLATTGSNIFKGDQTVTGSLFTSGSNTLIGSTTLTGSFNITGSTIQTGNNTLIGNTILSGSIIISGSTTAQPSVQVYGNVTHDGYIRFNPVSTNIDTSISASYIYVSGSTNDLYFSQNGSGYNNVTRLRWLEGNLYTGLLHGGLITTQSSTVYQISSGSGIIVDLNATLAVDPYPIVQLLQWGNLSASIAPFTSSFQQAFVGIDSTNNIFAQGTPFSNGQFSDIINIGNVLFQNQSTINGVKTQPSVAYGFEQQQNTFNRAFGPLKLSGYTLAPSGSSTGSLIVASGTAYAPGSNYTIDPNDPSYTIDPGTNISKIFRYHQSGSTWVYNTNAGAGFTTIDPTKYSNNGVLTNVGGGNWTIQRCFYFPNSVTKAIVVYYGNARYGTEAEARGNIDFESFVEAPNTSANAIYLGAIIINGTGVFTSPGDFTIYPGGLFRQVGGSGGGGSIVTQTLAGLSDVSISGPTNGQALVYNHTAAKWENSSTLIANLTGNASTATSASFATTASYVLQAVSASYATQALSASYAPSTPAFPFNGDAQISGSLGVTGSFSVLNSIDATNKVLIGVGGVPGSTANSVNWDSRTLFDSNGNFSIRWGGLRTMFDTVDSQSIAWGARLLKIDNGDGAYTVNWGSGILRDTGAKDSVDWQNRTTIDTGNKNSIDWQNRQLKDSSGNQNLNWSSGVSITGSLTVSGSSTFTNIGPARFSGSFIVRGDLIPGFPPFIPNIGPYDAIKVDDIAGQRLLYGTPYQGASASIDFGNRTLYTSDGGDALSWNGRSGTYETFLYNQQYITEKNRGNLFGYNSYGGQILGDSYFNIAVTDNDLVYLNTDGQWYQVDQTTNTSTKMLGIAKNTFSQTGSVVIEGDIVVTTATGYPAVANAGYGLPVYIKQGAGTAMDTAKPVSGYVRLLGHCYWNSGGGNDEWIMKFRPSHEWIEL